MQKSKKVAKAVATVTVFSVITRGLSFIFKIYLSRALGAEAMGLYQISLALFYLFASFSASGLPLVLSRKTAEKNALQEKENFSLLSSTLFVGISVALATLLVVLLCKPLLPYLVTNAAALPLVLVMIPAILSTTVYSVIRGWFWGKKDFTYFSVTETVEEGLRILLSVFFVSGIVSGLYGAYAIAVAFTVSDFVVAIILVILFFARGGRLTKPKDVKEIFFPALPITAMRVFSSLVTTVVAMLLPARLMTFGMTAAEATASFGRISGMANPLLLAPNAIISSLAIVLVPEMSESAVKKEYVTLNKHINTGISLSLLICGAFLLCFYALGSKLTLLLFNDEISGDYLHYATFLMLPMCVNQMTQSALNSIGKELRAFVNYIIGTALMVIAIAILPKYIGIYSVIVASGVSMLVTGTLNLLTLRKLTDFFPTFVKELILTVIYCIPCAFFAKCSDGVFSFAGQFSPVFGCFFGGAMYVALLVVTDTVDVRGVLRMRKGSTAAVKP